MVDLPIYNKILVVIINLIAIWLAFLVYKNNPKEKLNRTFVLMVVSMSFWVNFAFLARSVEEGDSALALLFLKIAWFFTPIFSFLIYFLVIYLLNKGSEYKILSRIILFLGLISAFVTGLTNLVVSGTASFGGNLKIVYGSYMFPFLAIACFFIFATLYVLFKQYLKSSLQEKRKMQYFLIGIFIFYIANLIFNITLPLFFGIVRLYWLGDYSTIFILAFTAYAIVKRELFDIKVFLTQALVVIIAILLLWQALIALPDWFDFSWKMLLVVLFSIFGRSLVKSVLIEIKHREQIERMAKDLERAYKVEKRANEELEKLDKYKNDFLTQTQHDLRSPLAVLMGYTDLLLGGSYGKIPKKAAEVIVKMQDVVQAKIRDVNNFLDVEQFKMGKGVISLKPNIELLPMLEDIVTTLDSKALSKDIYLKLQRPEKNIFISADTEKLKAALFNVVDNAIKYTERGGVTVSAAKNSESTVLIEIEDTGIGIPQDKIKNIFEERFKRTEKAKKTASGSGVGLALSSQIIKMHKGNIWCESAGEGKGSAFYIELPAGGG